MKINNETQRNIANSFRVIAVLVSTIIIIGLILSIDNTKDYKLIALSTQDSISGTSKNSLKVTFSKIDYKLEVNKKKTEFLEISGNFNMRDIIYFTAKEIIPLSNNKYLFHYSCPASKNFLDFIYLIVIRNNKMNFKRLSYQEETMGSKILDARLFNDKLILLKRYDLSGYFPEILKLNINDTKQNEYLKDIDTRLKKIWEIRISEREPTLVLGGKILNSESFILQGTDNHPSDLYPVNDDHNFIIVTDSNLKNEKEFLCGYSIVYTPHSEVIDGVKTEYPISLSPKGDKVAFLTRYTTRNSKNKYLYNMPLWLMILDLKDNSLTKILPLNYRTDPWRSISIKWNPVQEDIIVVSGVKDENEIQLINCNRKSSKSIGRKFRPDRKTRKMRWSPDGKKLAYLDNEGSLMLYDNNNNTFKEVSKNKDYFDFFFWADLKNKEKGVR